MSSSRFAAGKGKATGRCERLGFVEYPHRISQNPVSLPEAGLRFHLNRKPFLHVLLQTGGRKSLV